MKPEPVYLNELEIGDAAVIQSVETPGSIRRRLIDLGFISGTPIRCVLKKRRGESAAFLIRHTVIALRREDSSRIRVSGLPPEEKP